MQIDYSDGLERVGKLRLIEMGIPARTWKTPDICERFDPMREKDFIELL
jgi:hypothetical protein